MPLSPPPSFPAPLAELFTRDAASIPLVPQSPHSRELTSTINALAKQHKWDDALTSSIHLLNDDVGKAHDIVTDREDDEGCCLVHAILHRRGEQPDESMVGFSRKTVRMCSILIIHPRFCRGRLLELEILVLAHLASLPRIILPRSVQRQGVCGSGRSGCQGQERRKFSVWSEKPAAECQGQAGSRVEGIGDRVVGRACAMSAGQRALPLHPQWTSGVSHRVNPQLCTNVCHRPPLRAYDLILFLDFIRIGVNQPLAPKRRVSRSANAPSPPRPRHPFPRLGPLPRCPRHAARGSRVACRLLTAAAARCRAVGAARVFDILPAATR